MGRFVYKVMGSLLVDIMCLVLISLSLSCVVLIIRVVRFGNRYNFLRSGLFVGDNTSIFTPRSTALECGDD